LLKRAGWKQVQRMTHATRLDNSGRKLAWRRLGVLSLLLGAALAAGCGPEAISKANNPTPGAVPVPGMSKDDYAREMRERAAHMGGGGGSPAPKPGEVGTKPGGDAGAKPGGDAGAKPAGK